MESLAPLPMEQRTWRWPTYAALWVAMSFQPAVYSLGGSLMSLGLSVEESLVVTAIGSCLIAIFIVWNSVPGAALGVPFPVYARAAFGHAGAKVAAVSRGVVGVMWLSFQLWLSADGLIQGLGRLAPGLMEWAPIWAPYLNGSQLISLVFMAACICTCILIGVKHFDKFLFVAAPCGIVAFVVCIVWALNPAYSGVSLEEAMEAQHKSETSANRVHFAWIIGLNAVVSMWSPVIMNAADLSRMAPRQADQAWGQMIGIPVPMTLCVAIGIVCTSVVNVKSGEVSWMLADLFAYWPAWAGALGGVMICLLTLAVNIAANIIPPTNDFLNAFPEGLSWRACAYGTVLMGILICPFYLFHSATGFALKFLGGYGMVTGALYGVMVSDYYIVRGRQLTLEDLYEAHGEKGAFDYFHGHNWRAALATAVGVLLPLPEWIAGFVGASGRLPAALVFCGSASWFVSAAASAATYVLACWMAPPPASLGGRSTISNTGIAPRARWINKSGPYVPDASQTDQGGRAPHCDHTGPTLMQSRSLGQHVADLKGCSKCEEVSNHGGGVEEVETNQSESEA